MLAEVLDHVVQTCSELISDLPKPGRTCQCKRCAGSKGSLSNLPRLPLRSRQAKVQDRSLILNHLIPAD